MKKMYVEPDAYFTESMKKILEEGETDSTKKSVKKPEKKQSQQKKKQKK
ncbi:MAG: hypothetical protein IK102_08800 [Treponema sp.]|nr:hypothetical protein [Treponema sp.]